MKYSPFFFLLFLAICQTAHAQQLERQVLAAAGNAQTVNGITVCWTLGEVATATLTGGTITLLVGFQQPGSHGTTPTTEISFGDLPVKVYPNPAHDAITVELSELPTTPLKAALADAVGRVIIEHNLTGLTTTFDLHDLPAAIYFLYLTDGKAQVKTVRVVKN